MKPKEIVIWFFFTVLNAVLLSKVASVENLSTTLVLGVFWFAGTLVASVVLTRLLNH